MGERKSYKIILQPKPRPTLPDNKHLTLGAMRRAVPTKDLPKDYYWSAGKCVCPPRFVYGIPFPFVGTPGETVAKLEAMQANIPDAEFQQCEDGPAAAICQYLTACVDGELDEGYRVTMVDSPGRKVFMVFYFYTSYTPPQPCQPRWLDDLAEIATVLCRELGWENVPDAMWYIESDTVGLDDDQDYSVEACYSGEACYHDEACVSSGTNVRKQRVRDAFAGREGKSPHGATSEIPPVRLANGPKRLRSIHFLAQRDHRTNTGVAKQIQILVTRAWTTCLQLSSGAASTQPLEGSSCSPSTYAPADLPTRTHGVTGLRTGQPPADFCVTESSTKSMCLPKLSVSGADGVHPATRPSVAYRMSSSSNPAQAQGRELIPQLPAEQAAMRAATSLFILNRWAEWHTSWNVFHFEAPSIPEAGFRPERGKPVEVEDCETQPRSLDDALVASTPHRSGYSVHLVLLRRSSPSLAHPMLCARANAIHKTLLHQHIPSRRRCKPRSSHPATSPSSGGGYTPRFRSTEEPTTSRRGPQQYCVLSGARLLPRRHDRRRSMETWVAPFGFGLLSEMLPVGGEGRGWAVATRGASRMIGMRQGMHPATDIRDETLTAFRHRAWRIHRWLVGRFCSFCSQSQITSPCSRLGGSGDSPVDVVDSASGRGPTKQAPLSSVLLAASSAAPSCSPTGRLQAPNSPCPHTHWARVASIRNDQPSDGYYAALDIIGALDVEIPYTRGPRRHFRRGWQATAFRHRREQNIPQHVVRTGIQQLQGPSLPIPFFPHANHRRLTLAGVARRGHTSYSWTARMRDADGVFGRAQHTRQN
uniref:Uncharacterized protein n=1 Tax=Mycena chlorophos TaxID=658473 RepID=A0ABQ0L3A7_MYCCL|nr:predicted protein [Mycena chlorophos]